MKRLYKTLPKKAPGKPQIPWKQKQQKQQKPEPVWIYLYTDYAKRLNYYREKSTGEIATTPYGESGGGGGGSFGASVHYNTPKEN